MRLTVFLLGAVLGLGALFTSNPLAHSSVGRDILRIRKAPSSKFGDKELNFGNSSLLGRDVEVTTCEDWKKLVSGAELPTEIWADKLQDSFFLEPANIFFIGENHEDSKAKIHLPEIVRAFHKPGRAECLFLEFPRSDDDLFENIPSNSRGQKKALRKILARFKSSIPEEWLWPWVLAASEAKLLGMKVLSFDSTQIEKDLAYDVSEKIAMQLRNGAMSDTLVRLHETGKCEFSLTINGISHLISTSVDDSVKSLPNIVKEHGLKVHSLFLRSAKVAENDLRFTSGCDWTSEIKNPIFLNGPIDVPQLFPYQLTYDSFDFGKLSPFVFDSEKSLLIF
jgi:hypothetical protein